MKSLYESLLDDEDDVVDKLDMKPLIEEWLKKHGIKNYKITKDFTINHNTKDGISLALYKEEEFPSYIQFGIIKGDFNIKYSKLKTLRGCPRKVGGTFSCVACGNLTSLEGAPEKVGENFYCDRCNSLTSLTGAPKEVGRIFDCQGCLGITSLEGAPEKVGGNFNCSDCSNLTSLKGIPKSIGNSFNCIGCKKLIINKEDIKKICKVRGNIYI